MNTTNNHRTYHVIAPIYGSRTGWGGLIIADLTDQHGNTRPAVVADYGTHAGALAWLAKNKQEASKPELQKRLQAALGLEDADFAHHATDLYVVAKPGVYEWLKANYQYFANCQFFHSQEGSNWNGAGKQCIDIPFAGNW